MKEIALFAGTDVIGLELVNRLVPQLSGLGYRPIIVDSGTHRNCRATRQTPRDAAFYNVDIIEQVLLPFLDQKQPPATLKGTLKKWLWHAVAPGAPFCSYKQLAARHGLKYFQTADVNAPETLTYLESQPHLIGGIALRSLQIFEQPLIDFFQERGFLWNLHGGILPQYRGLLIPVWAKANNEQEYGWTMHHIAAKIDQGNILAICSRPLRHDLAVFDIYKELVEPGTMMIMQNLEAQTRTHLPGLPQNGEGTYYPYPDEALMEKLGLIYCQPVPYIENLLNHYTSTHSERTALKQRLIQAVAEHEHSKTLQKDTMPVESKTPDSGLG
ncbi:MAG: hypothetical protein LRY54_02535 [Alphaproteobacteria bacterium]|nr:hypothetical protein [Alphaproteobacteria bacterium]